MKTPTPDRYGSKPQRKGNEREETKPFDWEKPPNFPVVTTRPEIAPDIVLVGPEQGGMYLLATDGQDGIARAQQQMTAEHTRRVGRWFTAGWQGLPNTTTGLSLNTDVGGAVSPVNRVIAYPMLFPTGAKVDAIGTYFTVATSSQTITAAIYNDDTTGMPHTRISPIVTIPYAVGFQTATIDPVEIEGLKWLAFHQTTGNGGIVLMDMSRGPIGPSIIGASALVAPNPENSVGWQFASMASGLPVVFDSSAAVRYTGSGYGFVVRLSFLP